jgi:hypothetical protein
MEYQICKDFFVFLQREKVGLRYYCVVGEVQAKAIMIVASRISGSPGNATPSSSASMPSTTLNSLPRCMDMTPITPSSSPVAILDHTQSSQTIKSIKGTCDQVVMIANLIRLQVLEPTLIHCDNEICVRLSVNLVSHDKSSMVGVEVAVLDQGSPRKRELVGTCREADMEGKTFQHDIKERHS